jgi:hypothetical protein
MCWVSINNSFLIKQPNQGFINFKINNKMNHINRLFQAIFVLIIIAVNSSCVKEKFDAPPEITPSAGLTANMTIAQLYQFYTDSIPFVCTTQFGLIKKDIIIKGTVIGNDVSGNIYKTFYIDDGTAGLQVSVDMSDLYTTYRLGQEVYIKCKDLYLGTYSGVLQLGYIYNNAIGRMPAVMIPSHIFSDGKPGAAPVPQTSTIAGLTAATISRLVRLDSVYFDINAVGKPFSDHYAATNRILLNKNGSQLIVYTSNYANFAGQPVPNGYGSIVGILGGLSTTGTYQIYLRDNNDLINFQGVGPQFLSAPFSVNFGGFTPYNVSGAEVWAITTYGATMSGYSGVDNANEDWLISPSFNLNNYTNEILKFDNTMNYGSSGDGSLKLYYSTNYISGAPATATWTEITGFALSTGSWSTVSSGNIDMSAYNGTNVHIAFKYISTTSSAPTWEIKNLIGTGTPN